jgi:hypothetical protein
MPYLIRFYSVAACLCFIFISCASLSFAGETRQDTTLGGFYMLCCKYQCKCVGRPIGIFGIKRKCKISTSGKGHKTSVTQNYDVVEERIDYYTK